MLSYLPYAAAGLMCCAFFVEYGISIVKPSGLYGHRDTLTSVLTAAGYAVATLVRGSLIAGIFLTAYHASPWSWDPLKPINWVAALLVVDFFYYWSHRMSHSVHLMWAFHTSHHSSSYFNLSLGLRNSWFGGFIDWVFIVPALLLGFPPLLVGAVIAIEQFWDFMCHTPHVKKVAVIDTVFNSPSNHRVHHSSAREHLHCNFGGMFIIWDRLFGTYVPESGPLQFGLIETPKHPYNPFYLQVFQLFKKLPTPESPSVTELQSQ